MKTRESVMEVDTGVRRMHHFDVATGGMVCDNVALFTEQPLRLEPKAREWVAPKALVRARPATYTRPVYGQRISARRSVLVPRQWHALVCGLTHKVVAYVRAEA